MADLPIGTVVAFMGTTPPDGWLLCNGQLLIINTHTGDTTYKDLYDVIGTTYGGSISDLIITFKVPDLRECVLVGAGTNQLLSMTYHDEYKVGEFKDDAVEAHTHSYTPSGSISLNAHSHTISGHSHSFTPAGTITMNAHTHEQDKHKHKVTPKISVVEAGAHYHYTMGTDSGGARHI